MTSIKVPASHWETPSPPESELKKDPNFRPRVNISRPSMPTRAQTKSTKDAESTDSLGNAGDGVDHE